MVDTKKDVPSDEGTKTQTSVELQTIQSAYKLDGKNYLKWSQLIRTILKGKGKISHLSGTGPKQGDPGFEAWDEEDSMIMAWLWNSMMPEVSDTVMFMATSKDIWDVAPESMIQEFLPGEYVVSMRHLVQMKKETVIYLNMPNSELSPTRKSYTLSRSMNSLRITASSGHLV